MTEKSKVDKLLEKKKQLEAQIANMKAKERKEEEKRDTRRKILAGAYLLQKYKGREKELAKLLKPYLTRKHDKELFGIIEDDKDTPNNEPVDNLEKVSEAVNG